MTHADEPAFQRAEDLASERAVIGRVLVDCATVPGLLPEHFRGTPWRQIYSAATKLEVRGKLTLPELRLALGGDVDPKLLAEVMAGAPPAHLAWQFVEQLHKLARVRAAVAAADALSLAVLAGERARALEHLDAIRDALEPRCRAEGRSVLQVDPVPPEIDVDGLIQRGGLHLLWSVPNAGKTFVVLWLVLHMLAREYVSCLFEHPDLRIRRRWHRVLWIGTEETTGRLRWRADRVLAGMGHPELAGDLIHVWAADPRMRVTLDDLPELVERHEPDAVVVDPLTGLRPRVVDGERVRWDADNDRADEVCTALRGLAGETGTNILLVHHSDKSGSDYRGPTSWWASADVKLGLLPEDGRVKVRIEKMRDGAKLPPFYLRLEFTPDAVLVEYDGTPAGGAELKPADRSILAAVRAAGQIVQYKLPSITGVGRQWCSRRCRELVRLGLLEQVGEDRGSPIYIAVEKMSCPVA